MEIHDSILKTETKLIFVKADIVDDGEQNSKDTSSELSASDAQLEIDESYGKPPEKPARPKKKAAKPGGTDTDESYEPPEERLARAKKKAAERKKARQALRKNRTFACELCGKSYNSRSAIKLHRRTCNNPDIKSCIHCKRSFPTEAEFNCHMSTHKGQQSFRCRVNCRKTYKLHRSRAAHERKCTVAASQQNTENAVPPDQIIVDGVKMYVCRKTLGCEKAFFSLRNKNLHEEACQPLPAVKMEICVEESRLEEQQQQPSSPEESRFDERTVDDEDVCFVPSVKQEVIVIDDDDEEESIERDLMFVDGVNVYVCAKCGEAIECPDVFRNHKAECTEDDD